MASLNRQVVLLGIDGLPGHTLQLFLKDNGLPNFKKLIEHGSIYELVSTLPPLTCPAWMSMASGASPGTLGVTNILMPTPGIAPDQIRNGFDRSLSRAEYIWETLNDEGLKAIVIKYPGSWPPKKGDFIQVDGSGGYADITCRFDVVSSAAYFTKNISSTISQHHLFPGGYGESWRIDTGAEKGHIYIPTRAPVGWGPTDEDFKPAFEATLPIRSHSSIHVKFLYVLAGTKAGRPCILVQDNKQAPDDRFILYEKDWSSWIRCVFPEAECFIKLKLIHLDSESGNMHLYRSQGHGTSGFTQPASLASKLVQELGPVMEWSGTYDIMNGLIDLDTQLEIYRDHTEWLIRIMKHLSAAGDWQGLFTQWHSLEYAHHIIGASLHPEHPKHNPAEAPAHIEFLKEVYKLADELVGTAMSIGGKESLLVVTGDHGHDLVHSIFFINHFLCNHGYLNYCIENGKATIDWSKTIAYGHFPGFIYLNRKDWWSGGILDEAECPGLLSKISRELKDLSDNGKKPVDHVIDKTGLTAFGHKGATSADLYFSMTRGYEVATRLEINAGHMAEFEITEPLREVTSGHGSFFPDSPSARTVAVFSGPGIPAGFSGTSPISILDIAPTMSDFLGIRVPENCEGKTILAETNVGELL